MSGCGGATKRDRKPVCSGGPDEAEKIRLTRKLEKTHGEALAEKEELLRTPLTEKENEVKAAQDKV